MAALNEEGWQESSMLFERRLSRRARRCSEERKRIGSTVEEPSLLLWLHKSQNLCWLAASCRWGTGLLLPYSGSRMWEKKYICASSFRCSLLGLSTRTARVCEATRLQKTNDHAPAVLDS
ncbi:hypothetical protein MPTK1_4g20790 [Marchantia polymorpha subsp. ruderalis]|uniref:Uncharacterized protein n=2 Tax=Marchantia polymorpha TaxID=3197 RepID=A0AAF6BC37_MARPO|nr:hypothetical protein MARPO_0101s0025 [Marchantia polymorpha]PTQ32228.1 hypothetical protein MARPO_0101s0025 [Marchantia polymorpha]BBN09570.1 hypothetical protein Mp_4g20790 [Marchantia polymorpha subsp. ruderalis]BBN09571.1 hypothetical protein Mp_4g20790 [Marchantia polymorpha subsp. ruderalis]|eukprot:PTQ32227.1 hypothetical protein MARPO_0101s0025 [Marchantia polymorpha]